MRFWNSNYVFYNLSAIPSGIQKARKKTGSLNGEHILKKIFFQLDLFPPLFFMDYAGFENVSSHSEISELK